MADLRDGMDLDPIEGWEEVAGPSWKYRERDGLGDQDRGERSDGGI
jgi:hypothetical protein